MAVGINGIKPWKLFCVFCLDNIIIKFIIGNRFLAVSASGTELKQNCIILFYRLVC